MNDTAVVVIGRNEGERLVRCLHSIGDAAQIIYVDSGSTDGSVAMAAALGVRVVALDMSIPFTAARARNAGRAALGAATAFIQFVDGDCVLHPQWLARARRALDADPGVAAVFGRRREIAPEASRYNWLCDIEWAVAPGPARYFGGDVMIRAAALDAAGGYPAEMIAGEEPDLAIRLRRHGWALECLADEMTLHDAAIGRFSQWWRRTERSGHAYAELATRHRGGLVQDYTRRLAGVIFWSLIVPLGALVAALVVGPLAGILLLSLPLLQFVRLALRHARHYSASEAMTIALYLMLAKPAQATGAARFFFSRARGRATRLIEYKAAP